MNTIFAQMIEDCCYILAILIEMVKLFFFLVYALLCDDLTLLLGTCIMNCYMTVGIKEKERIIREEF